MTRGASRDNVMAYGFNRQMSYWSPEVRAKMLQSKGIEIEAFAQDRRLDPGLLYGIAEAAMRLGRIPDMGFYGLTPDDSRAFNHFLKDAILNTESMDEEFKGVEQYESVHQEMASSFARGYGKGAEASGRYWSSHVTIDTPGGDVIVTFSARDVKQGREVLVSVEPPIFGETERGWLRTTDGVIYAMRSMVSPLKRFGRAKLTGGKEGWSWLSVMDPSFQMDFDAVSKVLGMNFGKRVRKEVTKMRAQHGQENVNSDASPLQEIEARIRRMQRAAMMDPKASRLRGRYHRAAQRAGQMGHRGKLDLGERAEKALGEAVSARWDEGPRGEDPLRLWAVLGEATEEEIKRRAEGEEARFSFSPRIRRHKGEQRFSSKVLDDATKALGIEPGADFSQKFIIYDYDLGDERFRIDSISLYGSSPRYEYGDWRYEMRAENVHGVVMRKGGNYSLFVTDIEGVNVRAEWEEPDWPDRYEDKNVSEAKNRYLGRLDWKRSMDAVNKLARKYGRTAVKDSGSGEAFSAVYTFASEKNAQAFAAAIKKGAADFDESKVEIERFLRGHQADVHYEKDWRGDESWKVSLNYRRTKAWREHQGRMDDYGESIDEATVSGNMSAPIGDFQSLMRRTQEQLKADAERQHIETPTGFGLKKERRPAPGPGGTGSAFRRGAWTMDQLNLDG